MPKRVAENAKADDNKKRRITLKNLDINNPNVKAKHSESARIESNEVIARKSVIRTRTSKVTVNDGKFKDTFQVGSKVQCKVQGKNLYALGCIKSIHDGVDSTTYNVELLEGEDKGVLVAVSKDQKKNMLYHHDHIAQRLEDEDRIHVTLYKLLKQELPPQEYCRLLEEFKERDFDFDSMLQYSISDKSEKDLLSSILEKDHLQKLDSSLKDLMPSQLDQSRLLTSIMCLAGKIIGLEIDANRNQNEGKMGHVI